MSTGLPVGAPETSDQAALKVGSRLSIRAATHDVAIAWALAAGAGAVWITLADHNSVWRHALPIAVMLTYLAYGLSRPPVKRNTARLADSVYFLGFLWTLYALIVTLIFKGRLIRADAVFVVFGYALTTTAAGLFLRLLLIQAQRSVADQFTESREELDQQVAAFGERMQRVERTISHFHNWATATLQDLLTNMSLSVRQVEETFATAQKAAADHSSATVRRASEDFASYVNSLREKSKGLEDVFGEVTRQMSETVGEAANVTSRLRASLTRRLDGLDNAMENVVEHVSAIAKIDAPIAEARKQLGGLSSELETMRLRLAALPQAVTDLHDKVSALIAALEVRSHDHVVAVEKSVNVIKESAEKVNTAFGEAIEFVSRRIEERMT